jgi:hypothetical protein
MEMNKEQMLQALEKHQNLWKVTCFNSHMASMSKKKQEQCWKRLESLKFEDEDIFISRVIWNTSGIFAL